jgi:hypothetical protein
MTLASLATFENRETPFTYQTSYTTKSFLFFLVRQKDSEISIDNNNLLIHAVDLFLRLQFA